MTGRLAGETAAISGGAAGTERVTASLFAKEGARAAIVDIQEGAEPSVRITMRGERDLVLSRCRER